MKPIPLEVTMMKRIGELKADLQNCYTAISVKDAENARLKAEVERLKNNVAYLDKKLDEELDGPKA
jgi:predicted nuclease with TOPRIM domain